MFSASQDFFNISADEVMSSVFITNSNDWKNYNHEHHKHSFMNLVKFLAPFFWRKPETVLESVEVDIEPLNKRINQAPSKEHFTELLHNMGHLLKRETKSAGYVIYIKERDELFICPNHEEYYFRERQSWSLESNTIACEVVRTKRYLNVSTSRCNLKYPDFQAIPELIATNILTVPIVDYKGDCYGAVEVFREDGTSYSMDNVQKMKFMVQWVAESIRQNKRTVIIQSCNEINTKLLETLHQTINAEFDKDLDPFLFKVVYLARTSFDVESVNLFVSRNNELDKECTTDFSLKNDFHRKKLRLMKEIQIANLAYNSKKIINLRDVYNDPKYDRDIDKNTGKIIRSVLEIPIYGYSNEDIHGVLQIFNKMREDYFNDIDEHMIRQISRYCSIWIQYKRKRITLFKQTYYNLSYKNLTYDITTTKRSFSDYFDRNEVLHAPTDFKNLVFCPSPQIAEIARLTFYIFTTRCSKYISSKSAVYLFVYAVRKCYKTGPYTNFSTAFINLHTVFCILMYYPGYFDNLETFALLISAFCMNIDSSGQNVEYMTLVDDPILKIYDKDPLESHQFTLITIILAATDLVKASADDKARLLKLIQENILGKNLKMHVRYRYQLRLVLEKNNLNFDNPYHSYLVRILIIAVANFSSQAKPIHISKINVDNVIKEYIRLEIEISKLDKEKPEIKYSEELRQYFQKIHCNFMEHVGLPAFDLFRKVFPVAQVLYDRYFETLSMRKKLVTKYENEQRGNVEH